MSAGDEFIASNKLYGGSINQFKHSFKKFNWKFLENIQFNKEWMLAGGINYENLQYSLSITNAPIVDVSSGVEIKKGIKTKQKIIDFLDLAESLQ